MVSPADRDVVVVEPETDLVARPDAELVTERLRDHDLAFRPHSMSHTVQYNHRDLLALVQFQATDELRTQLAPVRSGYSIGAMSWGEVEFEPEVRDWYTAEEDD